MAEYSIQFNKPALLGNEMTYIQQAIANGHISGDGEFTRKCHASGTTISSTAEWKQSLWGKGFPG